MKIFFRLVCLLALWVVSSYVQAGCGYGNGVTAEVPGYVSFGNVVVQRDTPVGSVIATAITGAYNNGKALAGCSTNWTLRWELSKWGTLSSAGDKVYNTNISGVGIRLTAVTNGRMLPYEVSVKGGTYDTIPGDGIKAELIKTGDINGGTLDTGILARVSVANQFYFANVTLNGTNTISAAACSVTTPRMDVPLGRHDKNEFSGPGSTTDWKTFSIGLDCDAKARINVRIDPASGAVAGMTDVMNLDNGSGGATASGIGVQLWFRPNGGSAVKFGQETYYWTSGYGGRETVQLQARYYQTAQIITPGEANATATFTLSYK
ncbi:fimbrial protein [Salmonella enterica]|nr:fimbrial protein [Salmonella enterica]